MSADKGALTSTIRGLWPYLWPSDRADLRARILWATLLLLAAKLVTIAVPFTFKWVTDSLVPQDQGHVPIAALAAAPIALTLIYGAARAVMALLTQWRDGIFARVAMHAVRRLAYITFVHMHELSLRFHLERKTGGLTRVLERGRTATAPGGSTAQAQTARQKRRRRIGWAGQFVRLAAPSVMAGQRCSKNAVLRTAMSRPSTTCLSLCKQDVDARHKAGHDDYGFGNCNNSSSCFWSSGLGMYLNATASSIISFMPSTRDSWSIAFG